MINYDINDLLIRYYKSPNKKIKKLLYSIYFLMVIMYILYNYIYNPTQVKLFKIIGNSLLILIGYWTIRFLYKFIKNSLFTLEMNKVVINYKNSYNSEKLLTDLLKLKRAPINKSRAALVWKCNIIHALALTNNEKDSMYLFNNSGLTDKQKEAIANTTNLILKKFIDNNYVNGEIFWQLISEHNINNRLNISIYHDVKLYAQYFSNEKEHISISYSKDENKFFVYIKEKNSNTIKTNVFANEEKAYKYILEYLHSKLHKKAESDMLLMEQKNKNRNKPK